MTLPEPLCTPLSHVCHVYCFRNRQLKATRMVCCEENPIVSARCHVVTTPQPKLLSFHAWMVSRKKCGPKSNGLSMCIIYFPMDILVSAFPSSEPCDGNGTPALFRAFSRGAEVLRRRLIPWVVQPQHPMVTKTHSLCLMSTPIMRNWDPKERDLRLLSKLNQK